MISGFAPIPGDAFRLAARLALGLALATSAAAQPDFDSRINPVLTRVVIFFPPVPPPLDRPIVRTNLAPSPPMFAPSAELAAHVNEPFYAPLSTRLAQRSLKPEERRRLDGYRADKLALQRELRAELDQWRDADPPARRAALEEFARHQAQPLAQLEATAEALRGDLIEPGARWGALREWKLGEKSGRLGDSPAEISAVMRAAASYEDSFVPAQRRLLREIALELALAVDSATDAATASPYLFFAPEPARVLLPADLPAPLAALVADYETKKSLLKKELYDTVYAQERAIFSALRPNPFKALANAQAARLAALDTLAEEIRRGLAESAPVARAPAERSPLPAALQEALAAILRDHAELQKTTAAQATALFDQVRGRPLRVTYSFEPTGLKFQVMPSRSMRGPPSDATLRQLETLRAQFTALADDYGRQLALLINRRDAVRRDAGAALGNPAAAAVDAALNDATRIALRRDSEDAYREYRLAVFEPGLSPAQRRLLFDGAVERLNLPLPRGEFQPTRRAATW